MIQSLNQIPLRNFLIAVLLLGLSPVTFAAKQVSPIQVQFDQRVELISIIFYLAGNKEYAQCRDAAYLKAVDKYFRNYRFHPAVQMAAGLRKREHIWFGSPISFAVHLTPPFQLLPGTRDHASGGSLDFRWTMSEAQAFAQQV